MGAVRSVITWKCGESFEASDGTVFHPAILYNVASKNIGLVRKEKSGEAFIYADRLYTNPDIASARARELRDAYEAYLTNN